MFPFHYAFKVKDLESTRQFYIDTLQCQEGRSTDNWLDFNFFGHQLSAHLSEQVGEPDYCGDVDGIKVPIPHFGVVVDNQTFTNITERLEKANIEYLVKPQVRYAGKTGEQQTLFVFDHSGNPLEFKSLSNLEELFE